MQDNLRKLKPLPELPKKGKIYEMYGNQIDKDNIRKKLNELIELGCHQMGLEYKTGMIIISRKVWIEWIKCFGFPIGYEKREEWLDEPSLS